MSKERHSKYQLRSAPASMFMSKLRRQEQMEREQKRAAILQAENYYKDNVRSVEIYLYFFM